MSGSNDYAYKGTQGPESGTHDLHAQVFLIDSLLSRISTATLVMVKAVTNTPGQLTTVGNVDVLPLVNQLDGYGNATPHGIVHNLAYFRYQGGSNAVLIDPVVGDVGVAVFADRDISSVKSSGAQANPGSRRRNDMADGIYFGLCIAKAPAQYIQFTNDGITIADKNGNKISMNSNGIDCTSARLTNTQTIIAGQGGSDQVTLQNHTHKSVQTGSGNSGTPNAGT